MVWNLEDIPENEDVKIYRYVFKRSKNKEFSLTLTRFLNLYEYLKLNKFRSAEDLRTNILSNGKPLFNEKEAEEIFEMSVMRGGESKFPVLNNVFRQFLGWIYKWQPEVLQNFTDNVVDIKERLQIFKHIREDYELGEIYGLVLDSITEIIPMNVTVIENVANELPVVGPASGLIATMISSVLIVFNNIIHFTQGDDAGIIVDSFLMLPFIGTSLHSAAKSAETQLGNLTEKRQKLIDTIKKSFGDEEAELFAQYVPDLNDLDSYQPTMDSALSLVEKRGLPTSIDSLKSMALDKAAERGLPTSIDSLKSMALDKVAERGLPTSIDSLKSMALDKVAERGLPTSIDSVKSMALDNVSQQIPSIDSLKSLGQQHLQNIGAKQFGAKQFGAKQFGAKRLTSSRPHKKKWGTLRKLKQ